MTNLSSGGLCFIHSEPIAEGESVHIHIPIVKPPFAIDAVVRWCKQKQGFFLVGVALQTEDEAYCLRLVEQVCYIEQYRQKMLEVKGGQLSSEEAAKQWIEQHASQFKQNFY